MELCSLDDAFPNINTGSVHTGSGFPSVGGTDTKPSREDRRAARKRAKKVKGPALTFSDSVVGDLPPSGDTPDAPIDWRGPRNLPDPDRPAVKRMESVGTIQGQKEGFVMPTLPKASCLFSDAGTPSYFGKDLEDEEGFSNFSAVGSDNPNYTLGQGGDDIVNQVRKAPSMDYTLHPDAATSFSLKGADKAAGALPEPNVKDTWKPLSEGANYTAFVGSGKKEVPGWSMNAEHPREQVASKDTIAEVTPEKVGKGDQNETLLGRINELVGRLENLEKKKSQDSQTEILMFVGTGIFLLVSFELLTRR